MQGTATKLRRETFSFVGRPLVEADRELLGERLMEVSLKARREGLLTQAKLDPSAGRALRKGRAA